MSSSQTIQQVQLIAGLGTLVMAVRVHCRIQNIGISSGSYSVTLTVQGPEEKSTKIIPGLITVTGK
jgi:hypothetical protein